ncbi:Maf family nucleotide pyrophosphatase [Chryseobacterium koreense]|uniref:Maf family nucleotide pyrophosphatase n=1 Tax=Chryseobacterium koreense TaxID=232216 RepID=UPI0026EAFF31|nr:Maf family nucleotide pyrophosphatase [Chryseobacterium koreense]
MKILLASNSPRRKELLQNLGFDFDVISVDCEEVYPDDLPTEKVAEYLSELKANSFRNLEKGEVLITADTVVSIGDEILGKPGNEKEAKEMLQKLSGKTHRVFTGITIRTLDKTISKTDVAEVEFEIINSLESEYYVKNFRPFDKAGSYGIQEWLGMAKIKSLHGSFYTIMGLPTHLVYAILKDLE